MQSWQLPLLGQRRFPNDLTGFEIERFFSFSETERTNIMARDNDQHRVAVAVHLGFIRMTGAVSRRAGIDSEGRAAAHRRAAWPTRSGPGYPARVISARAYAGRSSAMGRENAGLSEVHRPSPARVGQVPAQRGTRGADARPALGVGATLVVRPAHSAPRWQGASRDLSRGVSDRRRPASAGYPARGRQRDADAMGAADLHGARWRPDTRMVSRATGGPLQGIAAAARAHRLSEVA